ncbi:cytochrome P450 [Micromonospora aurantiaca (nom. illeg.)]|uniref:cytochrome P450 n=1 Tax=Micromonospora aurantiaca (nom. illeg.) TaxID=47850 RepID=UPI0033E9F0BB
MTASIASRNIAAPRHRLYTQLRALSRDPLNTLDDIRRLYGDELLQLDLGLFRPVLATRPEHVEHVWKNSRELYLREGMMWTAMHRLQGGDGIGADGKGWEASRRIIQPLFTAKAVNALIPGMVKAVNEAVDQLAHRIGGGGTVDLTEEMMRITHRVLGRVLLGDVISSAEADTVGHEIAVAFGSMKARLALPFVPHRFPLPGDRRFRSAVRTVDAILQPHIARARADALRADVVSMLAHATDDNGQHMDTQRVRDDMVGLFTGGTETTALALTWTIVLLDAHPEITERVRAEIRGVMGDGTVAGEHVKRLEYTRMALDESLRLYPPAWMIPRTLQAPDELGGLSLPAGTTVILSPYMTHRMPHLWEQPDRFDPERFAPGRPKGRHPYAYFPFGGGVHRCLGQHFFSIESALALAALLSRFRMTLASPLPIRPTVSISLRPQHTVRVTLTPISRDTIAR